MSAAKAWPRRRALTLPRRLGAWRARAEARERLPRPAAALAQRGRRMSPRRVCAISVDLDEIHHYYAIHGLAAPAAPAAHQVYDTALARYRDFASAERLPLTLFVVGSDVARSENALA